MALWLPVEIDGSVVTCKVPDLGGDSTSVAGKLTSGVTAISFSTGPIGRAFAAVKSDGSVVTWGCSVCGGDSTEVSTKTAMQC